MKPFIENATITIIAVLTPVKSMVLTTLVLIVIDLITGLVSAHKKGHKITSAGLRRTLIKFLIYEIAIIAAYLTQTYLTGETIPVCSLVSGFIGLTEFTSVIENLNSVSGGKLLKTLIDKLVTIKK